MTDKINTKIKIPNEWYAGFKKSNEGLPRVYMTPNGKDRSSQSRINSIQRYSNGDRGIPDTVMDNTPLCGFKIVKPTSYGYNSSKIVWLIEDPRGFVSEIPSGNMSQLLALTTVDHCEILESCVWARDGKDNVLLPTNSREYQTAVKNTTLAKQTVHISKVGLGNIVHLKNGKRNLKYLGKYYEYTGHERPYSWTKMPRVLAKAAYYYLDTDGIIHSYGTGNVAELVDNSNTMTPFEAEEFINKRKAHVLMSVDPEIGVNTTINLIPIDIRTIAAQTKNNTPGSALGPYKHVLVAKFPGNVVTYCDYPNLDRGYHGKRSMDFRQIDQTDWVRGLLSYRTLKKPSRYNKGFTEEDIHYSIDLDDIQEDVDFYEVEFVWQTPHGEFRKMSRR